MIFPDELTYLTPPDHNRRLVNVTYVKCVRAVVWCVCVCVLGRVKEQQGLGQAKEILIHTIFLTEFLIYVRKSLMPLGLTITVCVLRCV